LDEFTVIINQLKLFNNLYDLVRVVDPLSKKICHYDNNKISISDESCYGIWKNNEFCKNCISMRAYNEKTTFVKIEYNKERLLMVTAFPVSASDRTYIVEFAKDITETGVIENFPEKSIGEIDDIVAKMNALVVKDELTDIYNRRYINERLPISMIQNLTTKKPLSIIMLDIDHFKKVNDTYGHIAGDYVLKEFAQLIKNSLRKDQDWVARYGGEEFLVVLDNVNSDIAYNIAETIRKKIENHKFQYEDKWIPITSSLGLCTLTENLNTLEAFIGSADKNLYKAKNSGRNVTIKTDFINL